MAQSLLSTAQAQQAGAAESAAAVEETRQTFTGVLSAAQNLKTVGTEVLEHAEVAQRTAQTIGRRIQELSQNTAHIGEILALVKEIANRSDLLASTPRSRAPRPARRAAASPSSPRRCSASRRRSWGPSRRSRG